MEKAPDAYRTISEVAEDLDLPQHVLRFWETRFGQIKPLKRGGGRRYYRPDDVELLKGIRHLLYKEGYTIKGVQRILKEHGVRAVQAVAKPAMAETLVPAMEAQAARPEAPRAAPMLQRPALAPSILPPPSEMEDEDAPAEFATMEDEAFDVADAPVEPAALPVAEEPATRPAAAPPPASAVPVQAEPQRGQVAMFRGGLTRPEGIPGMATTLEFASRARPATTAAPGISGGLALKPREAAPDAETLAAALDDLLEARAMIDRLLTRKAS